MTTTGAVPNGLDAADLRDRVQRIVNEFLGAQEQLLVQVSPDLAPLSDALAAMLAGGKRLRPAFAYWGWRGALAQPLTSSSDEMRLDDAAMRTAASLEFLQACALIHDDVMDGSDTRRGQPAAHRRFASLHRDQTWLGSPENFGVGAAILLGDLCLSWADQVLLTSGMPATGLDEAKAVYDEMRTELMAGQYLDLLEQARGGGSVERALRVVQYKSAKYTIERPLQMGAALACASAEVMDAYSAYGLPLGEAFQLRDDVLGVFGDPQQTGKPAGDDLREGKRTMLVALAAERANPTEASILRTHLGDPALGPQALAQLRAVIEDTGALADTETLIDTRLQQALDAADSPCIQPDARQVLKELAFAATRRTV
ncbi:MAG: polyprenyl synthetase family protein [Actinomycetales bacterium]